jgi:hypothetical protein
VKKKTNPVELILGSSVPVNLIAEQAFCELKVDLELRNPSVFSGDTTEPQSESRAENLLRTRILQSDQKREAGKKLHEDIATIGTNSHAIRSLAKVTSKDRISLFEHSLKGSFRGLPIIGRADVLHFDGRGNVWVIEWKSRDQRFLSASDDAQLRIYGFLLKQEIGFKINQLSLVGVVIPSHAEALPIHSDKTPSNKLIENLCKEPPDRSRNFSRWDEHTSGRSKKSNFWARVSHYDEIKLGDELNFFQKYWFGKREPIPTRKPAKCRSCRVNREGLCPQAIVKYS